MLELHTDEGPWEISGRGDVYGFKGPLPACCPSDLQGQHVLINGANFTIIGVECFMINFGHNHPYPQSFEYGLLVKPWKGRGFTRTAPPLEFESLDSFQITGRGQVFMVEIDNRTQKLAVNDPVIIDGTKYRLRGMETKRPMQPVLHPDVENVGLLVGEFHEEV